MKKKRENRKNQRWYTLASSILFILGISFAIGFGLFALSVSLEANVISSNGSYPPHNTIDVSGAVIGFGILIILPACLSAIVLLSIDPYGTTEKQRGGAALVTVLFVLVVGGAVLREGLICVIILLPLWLVGIILGATVAEKMQKRNMKKDKLRISVLAILPFIVLFADVWVPRPTSEYQVSRTIIIDAPANEIWPHLLRMENITQTEGQWTFPQNIMGIPRPRSALIKGNARDAIRYARWGKNIHFEEHITLWEQNQKLHWNFVFPDNSISQYTDRHIAPKGPYLDMHDGGYELIALANNKTKLVLETNYIVTTPVNLYGKIWGEIILGGLQNNILTIVKNRAEK